MKRFTIALLFLGLVSPRIASVSQTKVIEVTRDNPATLISTSSSNYRILGLRLGMSRPAADKILRRSKVMVGVQDEYNPSRIYVYGRKPRGGKRKELLYLLWEPNRSRLGSITIFQDFRDYLTPNFRRLLDLEAVDDSSPFKKEFIGAADKSEVTLDIASIGTKHITYFYNSIGLEVTDKRHSDKREVVFAIAEKGVTRYQNVRQ